MKTTQEQGDRASTKVASPSPEPGTVTSSQAGIQKKIYWMKNEEMPED